MKPVARNVESIQYRPPATTKGLLMHITKTELDSDARDGTYGIALTEVATSKPSTRTRRAGTRHLVTGFVVVSVAGSTALSATLVQRTAADPAPAPVPAAISPTDAILGYLLSDEFPDVRIAPVEPVPSPIDLTLGYLFSTDVPDVAPEGG